MNERAAFEQSIDENPLDSNTHAVYADWLEENGEHDEAAFRRSMGDYVRGAGQTTSLSHNPGSVHPFRVSLQDGRERYPAGVSHEYMPLPLYTNQPAHQSANLDRPRMYAVGYHWPTYRNMENAFRTSFMAARRNNAAEQMSRRVRARKMSRRGF